MPLAHLKTGSKAIVVSLDDMSAHERNKLMSLGVMAGAEINLMQRFPSYVISIGYTQLAIDHETAQLIRVTQVHIAP